MADGLISCPFCGGPAKLVETRRWPKDLDYAIIAYTPVCSNPDCVIYNADTKYYKTKQESIEAWNKRSLGNNMQYEINLFDEEETYPDCTVQVLRNSITGSESVGWWRNDI